MIDPATVTIQGDISRADVAVLVELGAGKRVVEFGVGGSTLILAQCAASLISYDTNQVWIDRTQRRLDKLSNKTCDPTLKLSPDVPNDIEECDFLFLDGYFPHRRFWLKHLRRTQTIAVHDSRGEACNIPAIAEVMAGLCDTVEMVQSLDIVHFHYNNSNMVVIRRRQEPAKFVNWNDVERDNRLDPYAE